MATASATTSSERYNVAPVLRWQLNETTAITLEGDYLHNRHPLDRGVTRYANQQASFRATASSVKRLPAS